MNDLKPCPFCGGEAEYENSVIFAANKMTHNPVCLIRCTKCKASMGEFVAEDSSFAYKDCAKEAWNRRAENG